MCTEGYLCRINLHKGPCPTSPEHFVFVFQVLGTVSLPSDLPGLSVAAWLSAAERHRVTTIARLLNHLPTESSAVITSADTLLTELFSHRGETVD